MYKVFTDKGVFEVPDKVAAIQVARLNVYANDWQIIRDQLKATGKVTIVYGFCSVTIEKVN